MAVAVEIGHTDYLSLRSLPGSPIGYCVPFVVPFPFLRVFSGYKLGGNEGSLLHLGLLPTYVRGLPCVALLRAVPPPITDCMRF